MFFHAVRRLLLRLRQVRDRGQDSRRWRFMSEAIDQPLALPYIMVTGPRWNPHALIANVGPLQVTDSFRVQTETAFRSAQMWTLVIYSASDFRTVTAIDSSHVVRDEAWCEHTLPPGRYSGILRYYEWSASPKLPAIEIDGAQSIPERTVPANENDYLSRLCNKNGAFYTALHYYALEMLRLRHYLPESFVRREYLPVGNPETAFRYGHLQRGQCIEITSSQGIPEGQYLYLTIYNRSSFPVTWAAVQSLPYHTQPAEATGSYLLRLHATESAHTPPTWPSHLEVIAQ